MSKERLLSFKEEEELERLLGAFHDLPYPQERDLVSRRRQELCIEVDRWYKQREHYQIDLEGVLKELRQIRRHYTYHYPSDTDFQPSSDNPLIPVPYDVLLASQVYLGKARDFWSSNLMVVVIRQGEESRRNPEELSEYQPLQPLNEQNFKARSLVTAWSQWSFMMNNATQLMSYLTQIHNDDDSSSLTWRAIRRIVNHLYTFRNLLRRKGYLDSV